MSFRRGKRRIIGFKRNGDDSEYSEIKENTDVLEDIEKSVESKDKEDEPKKILKKTKKEKEMFLQANRFTYASRKTKIVLFAWC